MDQKLFKNECIRKGKRWANYILMIKKDSRLFLDMKIWGANYTIFFSLFFLTLLFNIILLKVLIIIQKIITSSMQKQQTQKFYLHSLSKKTKFQHYPIKPKVIELLKDQNFQKPTLVQAESLPITLQDNLKSLCTILYAYNGAGKTLSYLIPILNSLENIPCVGQKISNNKDTEICRPQALIIVPTEALLAQLYDYLQGYSQFYQQNFNWHLKIGRVYSTIDQKGHILIGLTSKIHSKLLNTIKFDYSQLKWIIFDECDMVKQNSDKQFAQILNKIADPKLNISSTNLIITSATGQKQKFREFIQDNLTSHNILQLDSKTQNKGLEGITHYYSMETNKDKSILDILQKFSHMRSKSQIIIFFNTIPELRKFYVLMKKGKFYLNDERASQSGKNNLNVDYIHGQCTAVCKMGKEHIHPDDCSASKTERVTRLRNKEVQVLLGTETIGRGIDIRTVTLVINYNQPKNRDEISPTAYIHRVGRTGRYSDEGVALTFLSDTTFIKKAEQQEKIKFIPMTSQDQIIKHTLECTQKNTKSQEENKHRYDYDDE